MKSFKEFLSEGYMTWEYPSHDPLPLIKNVASSGVPRSINLKNGQVVVVTKPVAKDILKKIKDSKMDKVAAGKWLKKISTSLKAFLKFTSINSTRIVPLSKFIADLEFAVQTAGKEPSMVKFVDGQSMAVDMKTAKKILDKLKEIPKDEQDAWIEGVAKDPISLLKALDALHGDK